MTHDELRDSYELYALGLAEDPEAADIGAHLAGSCAECTAGVRHAREMLALLGSTAPDSAPPARLRRRVLALTGERTGIWNWAVGWAALAACALVAALIFNFGERRARTDLALVKSQAATESRELARVNAALAILNAPEARQVVFGEGKPQPPRGRVFVDPQRGVLLVASNLPQAPAGKTYEMWIIPKGGKPAPAGLFQSESDGTALYVESGPVDIAQVGAVAVTLEPAGGVPQPTSQPVIVAAL